MQKTAPHCAAGRRQHDFERTVAEIAGDYAVLVSERGTRTEVALALLPDGIREGTVLICEDFEYRIKTL